MKFRVMLLLAALLLPVFSGCGMGETRNAPEGRMGVPDNAIQTSAVPTTSPQTTAGPVTREQAQAIALEHAGFTPDQVTQLRTEYEIDDGIARFEVQFRQGRWEYDYEINADTGAILSYDRDD